MLKVGTRVLCNGSLPGTGINLINAFGVIRDLSSGGYGVTLDEPKENAAYWFLTAGQVTPLPDAAARTVGSDSIDNLSKREYFAVHLGSAVKADALIEELNAETKTETKPIKSTKTA